METIRTNEELRHYLEVVPKGVSYADYILEKFHRLECHEKNAVCWVVENKTYKPYRTDLKYENPIKYHHAVIEFKIPISMENNDIEKGWLRRDAACETYAHSGFASSEAARSYIIDVLHAKKLSEYEKQNYEEDDLKYRYTLKYMHHH
jgi:hypothetical protein